MHRPPFRQVRPALRGYVPTMTRRQAGRTSVAMVCGVVLSACGGGEEPGSPAPSQANDAPRGQKCDDVTVPGPRPPDRRPSRSRCRLRGRDEGGGLRRGPGRAPYESDGFTCRPNQADGGDTDYNCTMGSARVTFRYGTT